MIPHNKNHENHVSKNPHCHTVIVHAMQTIYNTIMYSVKQAAEKLGMDRGHIRRLLGKGLINGEKVNNNWVVFDLTYKRRKKPKGTLK